MRQDDNALKLLIVAAWEPELTRARERHAVDPSPTEVTFSTLGVGLVEAGMGMTQCIVRHQPELALLVGTAGVFRGEGEEGPVVGEVVVASRVRLLDASVLDGTSALPAPMPTEVMLDAKVRDALVAAGARSVQIANTVGITVDDAHASRLHAAHGDDVEHLEAFAFARACAASAVPCGIVLGIANVVGSSGRAEWLANHTSASASAADLAWRALPALLRTTTRAQSPERA